MHWGQTTFVLAKILHVLVAAVWVGATTYGTLVIGPMMQHALPATRREVMGRLAPLALKAGNILGGTTLLTGLILTYVQRDGYSGLGQGTGRYIAAALILNLAVLYLINFALRPTYRAMGKVMADLDPTEPPPAVVRILQIRLVWTGRLSLLLLWAALAVMVVANTGL